MDRTEPGTMKIARLSEAARVSKSTIHNYVRAGLLPPPQKVGLNVHLYSQRHLTRLLEIRRLREEDHLTIEQILDEHPADGPSPFGAERSEGALKEDSVEPQQTTSDSSHDKRRQIVDTAIELFNRLGYERVRISDITESINIGKGTFYLYFSNKRELLLECFNRLATLIITLEGTEQVKNASGFFETTRPRFVGAQAQYSKMAGIMNLIRTASLSADPEINRPAKKAFDAIIAPLRKDLEQAVREGKARKIDAELAVYSIVGAFDNLCYRETIDDRYTAEEITDFMQDFVEHALRSDPPRSRGESAAPTSSGSLTDREGTRIPFKSVLLDGKPYLPATLGQAALEVGSERIASVTVGEADGQCRADVKMKDGTTASLQVAGDVMVSGETALGTIRIALRNVSEISFG